MSWGYKISIVIILFIVSMCIMVAFAFKQSNPIIDDNYYQKEIEYQGLIDASKELNKDEYSNLLTINESQIIIKLPNQHVINFENGEIELLNYENEVMDIKKQIILDKNGIFSFQKSEIKSGSYLIRIKYKSLKKNIYFEKQVDFK